MTATNRQPAKDVPGVIAITESVRDWARTVSGDPTVVAASRAITHHNWHAADSMPTPHHYRSSAASAALEAVSDGVLPREAFNNETNGNRTRTTTGMQAAVTLKLLDDAGAPSEYMSVLAAAYGVDLRDVRLVWVRPNSDEQDVVEQSRIEGTGLDGFQQGGRPYVEPPLACEDGVERAFIPWNADAIDRGTKAHKEVEVEIANLVRESGLLPLAPRGGDEPFDVAWVADGVLHVCEVKSLTSANQESQLRLGLGQLLGYLYRTKTERWQGVEGKRGVLAVEGPPKHLDWVDVCAEHGVTLTWPERFRELFGG